MQKARLGLGVGLPLTLTLKSTPLNPNPDPNPDPNPNPNPDLNPDPDPDPNQAREQLLKNVLGQGGWSTRFLVLTPEYLYFFKDTPKKVRAKGV